MSRPVLAVVIACYNTSAACAEVVSRAATVADAVLAVDDGSTDDTAEHLRRSGCRVLRLPVNAGKGAALEAGLREVLAGAGGLLGRKADYVLTVDGDGQHDPAEIPRFLACAESSGADFVLGTRDPREMPRKSAVGSHFSRLLFVIGTATFVADTQSGYRLLSVPLVADLIDRVTWKGYEAESDVLGTSLALGYEVAAVRVSTIYIDGNRGSQFRAWRDSVRIASVFAGAIGWTVATAAIDLGAFSAIVLAGWLSPAAANVASRLVALAAQAALRRDFAARATRLVRREGLEWCLLALAGHLAVTTTLVAGLAAAGLPPVAAKVVAQLAGYLGTFAIVDQVLLRRASRSCASWAACGAGPEASSVR